MRSGGNEKVSHVPGSDSGTTATETISSATPSTGSSTGLGDVIHRALSSVGVTPERVSRWVGRECGCKERQDRLNSLSFWARRVMAGKTAKAVEFLKALTGQTTEGGG
jgi:hypothetical protein